MKETTKIIIAFILGILVSGVVAYATSVLSSDKVSYDKTTVKDSLDNLFNDSLTGKNNIISALSNKGFSVTNNSTYNEIVNSINELPITLAKDEDGNYGYILEGSDTVNSFNGGSEHFKMLYDGSTFYSDLVDGFEYSASNFPNTSEEPITFYKSNITQVTNGGTATYNSSVIATSKNVIKNSNHIKYLYVNGSVSLSGGANGYYPITYGNFTITIKALGDDGTTATYTSALISNYSGSGKKEVNFRIPLDLSSISSSKFTIEIQFSSSAVAKYYNSAEASTTKSGAVSTHTGIIDQIYLSDY